MAETAAASRQLIGAQAVATKLGCSKRTVHRLRDRGVLPRSVKLGASRRWDEQKLDQWIEEGCPDGRSNGAAR